MDEQPQNPTVDETTDAKNSLTYADAAKAVTNALGDDIVPDRILKREAPSQQAVVQTPAPEPTQPAVPEQPVEETPSEQPETTTPTESTETATTPSVPQIQEEAPAVEAPEEEEYVAQTPAPTLQPLDSKAFVDENGYVDVNKLTESINQTISQVQQTASATAQRELNAQRLEERQWNQATERFPQLKTDKGLRDIVQQARIGQTTELYQRAGNDPQKLSSVKIPTPTQIATELFKRLGDAKSQGVKDATENVKIQQTAYQETASTPGDSSAPSKRQELFGQIRNPDPIRANQAQKELLKDLLFAEQ